MAGGDGDEGAELFPELLSFAGRAQWLISDLLSVSEGVPSVFHDRRFDPVLFDLSYLENPDDFEARINGNRELQSLEDELRESCSAFLKRFFLLASGITHYHEELLKYLENLQDGVLMQYQLDKILENESGRQLLAEALTFFGFLLLLMEHRMGGVLREKLLVAHLRFDHCSDILNLENICKLCRLHPFSSSPPCQDDLVSFMIVVHSPEDLFARFPFPKKIVDAIICHIRDGDLYRCLRHYPDPQHRTVALSSQAGYLYVLLLYSPESLQNGFLMREIVDRFFRDCWVCPIFLYFSVDLSVSWDAHREAKMALSSYLSSTFVSDRTQLSCAKVKEVLSELDSVLSDGVLTKNYVLENSHHLISLVRTCNVFMRWILLHKSSIDKKLRDIVISVLSAHQIGDETLLLLLLKICRLEFEMKCFYSKLLEGREASWHDSKHCASDRMKEIAHFFSGPWASSYKMKNESLEVWFGKLLLEVHSLDYSRARNSEKKLYHILSALKDVEQVHQVEENQPVRKTISEVQQYLQDMLKALNVGDDTLCTFSTITGSIYAWSFIEKLFALLRKKIEQDSLLVLNLHCFFLKFSPLLDAPISRISRSKSSNLQNRPSHYALEYVSRVRSMSNFLPVMVFRIFNEDTLHDLQPFNLPSCVEIANLKDLVQSEEQSNLMEAVNKISIFSQGMLLMSRHLNDLIELDLKNWTERQISMELSRQLDDKSKSFFISTIVEPEEFEVNMKKLTSYVLSQQHMMECLQDFLHIRGNQIWNEVLSEFLKDSAQQEADSYLRRLQGSIFTQKLNDLSSAQTLLGRLLHQILHLTSPSRSMFIEPMSGWFNLEGHQLFGLHFFNLLELCLGTTGLTSLDSLLYCAIKVNLENIFNGVINVLDQKNMEELCKLDKALGPAVSLPLLGRLPYQPMLKSFSTLCQPWAGSLATVGQLQLLRHMISLKLNSSCKVINNQGTIFGRQSPFSSVYMCKDSPPLLSRCMSIITISQLSQYVFDPHLGTLICQMKKATDFSPMIIGLGTFINQFHSTHMAEYLQYMGQYVRTVAGTAGIPSEPQKGGTDPESEVTKSAFWLMNFCKHMEIPKDILDSCLPPALFPVLQT